MLYSIGKQKRYMVIQIKNHDLCKPARCRYVATNECDKDIIARKILFKKIYKFKETHTMKKVLSIIAIVLATAALANATTATATNFQDSTQNPETDGTTIVYVYVPVPELESKPAHNPQPNDKTEEQVDLPHPAHNPLPMDHEMPDVSHNERDAGDEEEFTYVKFNYNPLPQDVIDFLLGEGEATDTVMAFVDTYTWECTHCKNDITPDDMVSDKEDLEQRRATRMAAELPHRCAEAAAQYMRIQLVSAKKSLYTLQNLFADAKRYGMEIDATLARDVDILHEDLKEVYNEAHQLMEADRVLWDAFWDVFDTYFDVFYLDHDIMDYECELRNPIPTK